MIIVLKKVMTKRSTYYHRSENSAPDVPGCEADTGRDTEGSFGTGMPSFFARTAEKGKRSRFIPVTG